MPSDHLSEIEHFKIEHDTLVKAGLKDKERFKSFLKFALSAEKFNALDFDRLEFVDTELLKKTFSKKMRKIRADLIVKIGLKEMDTNTFVCIIVEHKSNIESRMKAFLQIVDYNVALIEAEECPAINILLVHGKFPSNMPSDLMELCGWTPEMRRIFGDSSLNCGLNVVDLNKRSEQEIEEAGSVSSLCLALKNVWNLTRDKTRSILGLCYRDRKDSENYKKYVDSLNTYILQATDYSKEVLEDIEAEVIKKKEDRAMPSTYNKLIDEGRQEEKQNVILKMLKDKMNIQMIVKYTGTPKEKILEIQKQANL